MTAARPGNLASLQKAAAARTAATAVRTEAALDQMLRTGQPVTFRGLAAAAPVSLDFLYRNPAIRQRVEQLDNLGRVTSVSYPGTTTLPTTSFVYDADGRVQTVTVTANGGASTRTTSMTYDQFLAG